KDQGHGDRTPHGDRSRQHMPERRPGGVTEHTNIEAASASTPATGGRRAPDADDSSEGLCGPFAMAVPTYELRPAEVRRIRWVTTVGTAPRGRQGPRCPVRT